MHIIFIVTYANSNKLGTLNCAGQVYVRVLEACEQNGQNNFLNAALFVKPRREHNAQTQHTLPGAPVSVATKLATYGSQQSMHTVTLGLRLSANICKLGNNYRITPVGLIISCLTCVISQEMWEGTISVRLCTCT